METFTLAFLEKNSTGVDTVKSPMRIVYRSESDEAVKILNEMGIKPPDRILVGALPEMS